MFGNSQMCECFAGTFIEQESWNFKIFAILLFQIDYYSHQLLFLHPPIEETTVNFELQQENFKELQANFWSFLFNILSGSLLNLMRNLCQILAGFDYFEKLAISVVVKSDNLTNFA